MLKPSANIIHTPHMNQYSLVIAVAKRARQIAVEAEQEIIGILGQTGEDQQPQGVFFKIPGVPVAVGDGEQEDGGGDAADVVSGALES